MMQIVIIMKGNCVRVDIRMMQIVIMKGNFLINHPPQSSMIGLNKLLVEFGRINDCTAFVASNSILVVSIVYPKV